MRSRTLPNAWKVYHATDLFAAIHAVEHRELSRTTVLAKPVIWLGDSLRELKTFPRTVQDEMGYAIYLAQCGQKHVSAKPLKGLGPGVLEVVSDHRGNTFRSVYTVRFADRVFVLHAFQKKSKSGSATPTDINLMTQRLKQAVTLSKRKD